MALFTQALFTQALFTHTGALRCVANEAVHWASSALSARRSALPNWFEFTKWLELKAKFRGSELF